MILRFKQRLPYILLLIIGVLICSCARIASQLSGGIKDETPPKIIESGSSPNFQTNFEPKKIVLEFDEFIQFKNPISKLVISPPLDTIFNYKQKGKTLELSFYEDWKEDVTYQINFGDAIQDFTESNALQDFTFVFSTGDKLDSLMLSGFVKDAYTGEVAKEVLVCLYDNLQDSVLYKERPLYFDKTDEYGRFDISNLKSDTFQLFVLQDVNANYKYDSPNELVGYLDSTFVLTDSFTQILELDIFDEEEDNELISIDQSMENQANILFKRKPQTLSLTALSDSIDLSYYYFKDTLKIEYSPKFQDSLFIEYTIDDNPKDTLFLKENKVRKPWPKLRLNVLTRLHSILNDTLSLSFNQIISSVDTSLIVPFDSMSFVKPSGFKYENNNLYFSYGKLSDSLRYGMKILPEGIKSQLDSNQDTLEFVFKTKNIEELGKIKIVNTTMTDSVSLIYELLLGNEVKSIKTNVLDSVVVFDQLDKGKYSIRITDDINNNGKWDAGRLIGKRKSERVKLYPIEELKQGWEVESRIE